METIDAAERSGQGVFGLSRRHRRRICVDDLCRPALRAAAEDSECINELTRANEPSCFYRQSGAGQRRVGLYRRGRKLEELAVAECADGLAEVPVRSSPHAPSNCNLASLA